MLAAAWRISDPDLTEDFDTFYRIAQKVVDAMVEEYRVPMVLDQATISNTNHKGHPPHADTWLHRYWQAVDVCDPPRRQAHEQVTHYNFPCPEQATLTVAYGVWLRRPILPLIAQDNVRFDSVWWHGKRITGEDELPAARKGAYILWRAEKTSYRSYSCSVSLTDPNGSSAAGHFLPP